MYNKMSNKGINIDKKVNSAQKNKDLENQNVSSNDIPANWKKFGEIYSNQLHQSVYVCSICMEKTKDIKIAFTTVSGSAFWGHIKTHRISQDSKIMEQPPAKKSRVATDSEEYNQSKKKCEQAADPTALQQSIKIEKDQILTPNEFHNKLIDEVIKSETNELYQLDIKEEAEDYDFDKEENRPYIKGEEMANDKFSNCDYYYDDQVHTVSDDDDDDSIDDDDDDEDVNDEGHDPLRIARESRSTGYLEHKDMIEISDDDDDYRDMFAARPNSSLFPMENSQMYGDADTMENITLDGDDYFYKCTRCTLTFEDRVDYLKHRKSHEIEKIVNSFATTNGKHSIRGIPTPDISPCESVTNQHINTNSNQCNYAINRKRPHRASHLHQRQRLVRIRPFQCKICYKRTTTEQAMQLHQRRFHSSLSHLSTTQCEICEKRIYTPKLQQHMIVHSTPRYKCDYCEMIYKHKQSLNMHVKRVHTNENFNFMLNPNPKPVRRRRMKSNINTKGNFLMQNNGHHEQLPSTPDTTSQADTTLTPEDENQIMFSLF